MKELIQRMIIQTAPYVLALAAISLAFTIYKSVVIHREEQRQTLLMQRIDKKLDKIDSMYNYPSQDKYQIIYPAFKDRRFLKPGMK